jgi:hypothetical protein
VVVTTYFGKTQFFGAFLTTCFDSGWHVSSLSINSIDIASYTINFVLSTGSSNCIYYLSKLVCDGLQNYLDFELMLKYCSRTDSKEKLSFMNFVSCE